MKETELTSDDGPGVGANINGGKPNPKTALANAAVP